MTDSRRDAIVLLLLCAASCGRMRAGEAAAGTKAHPLMLRSERIADALAGMMGVTLDEPPRAAVLSRDAVGALLEAELAREMPPEEVRFQQASMIRFGLVPGGFDLRDTFLALMTDQVGGCYIPREKTLYLIEDMPMQGMIIAHELTHALQDRLHDLGAMIERTRGNDDRARAAQSVYEGEATLAMSLYMAEEGSRWEVLSGMAEAMLLFPAQNESLRAAPLVLREGLLFPYFPGHLFVTRAFRKNGFGGIRKLYARLPESTEQILHPVKYFGRPDRPTGIALDRVLAPLREAGWNSLGENVMGEFGAAVLLRSLGLEPKPSNTAAEGWDGDRYALLRKEEDGARREALVWLSTWDSPDHAYRFLRAYERALSGRYGRRPETDENRRRLWTLAEERAILLTRWDREVLLLDGWTPAERDLLRRTLSRAKTQGWLFEADRRADAAPVRTEPRPPAGRN